MDKYFHPTLYNGCNYLSMLSYAMLVNWAIELEIWYTAIVCHLQGFEVGTSLVRLRSSVILSSLDHIARSNEDIDKWTWIASICIQNQA